MSSTLRTSATEVKTTWLSASPDSSRRIPKIGVGAILGRFGGLGLGFGPVTGEPPGRGATGRAVSAALRRERNGAPAVCRRGGALGLGGGLGYPGLSLAATKCEQRLLGAGGREMEGDAPGVADDDGADLQELEADGAALGAGHVGALEREAADRLDQAVGERRQDQPELVGPPVLQEVRSANRSNCCSLMRFSISPRWQ